MRASAAPTSARWLRADRSLSQIADPASGQDIDVLALHEALDEMAVLDPRQAEIVELRYFGGLTEAEVATSSSSRRSRSAVKWRPPDSGWVAA